MAAFISVVIPTHDRRDILRGTLHALFQQTYPKDSYEVIVVSDASDGTNEMIEELAAVHKNLRLVRATTRWPDRKRNIGIETANGAIIAFTDDDCLPNTMWLEMINDCFSRNPHIVGVEGKTTRNTKGLFYHASENLRGGLYPTCNLAFTKGVLQKVGGFDENYHFFREDTDLAFRVLQYGEILFDERVEVFHPPRRIPKRALLRELLLVRSDVRLYKKFPVPYKKTFGLLCGGNVKQSLFLWSACILLFFSVLYSQILPAILIFFTIPLFKYVVSLRGKEYSLFEAMAFIPLSSVRDLLFPLFFAYYIMTVKL